MKKFVFFAFSFILFISCKNNPDSNKRILTDSSGNINTLTVVIDNNLWEGSIGEAIRENMAAPVKGLPQEEPLFSLSQIPPKTFTGFVRKNRLFLQIKKDKEPGFQIVHEEYARPQTGVIIKGENSQQIVSEINKHADSIVNILKKTEIKEKQRRIGKGLKSDEVLQEKFGLSLNFPNAYRYAVEEDDFVWIRKDLPKGNMEILVYQVPMQVIDKDTSVVANIIKMRDSIGEKYIPGPVDGSHMITEKAYAPYLFETKIDGKFAYETRGTWEVTNAFMAGPFVNYAVRDEENNRYLILEGFVFSPSIGKRDNIFEIDAILRSAKIK